MLSIEGSFGEGSVSPAEAEIFGKQSLHKMSQADKTYAYGMVQSG